MRTVRHSVFETNSSSMHSLTYSETRRDPGEFPRPNDDGILEVELKTYWECSGECVTDEVSRIIEYMCAQSIYSGGHETKSHGQCLSLLQEVYAEFGLPEITDFICYVIDMHGVRHQVTGENWHRFNMPADEDGDAQHDDAYPDIGYRFGVTNNCLTDDDFDSAVNHFYDGMMMEYYSPYVLLATKSTLTFYRT